MSDFPRLKTGAILQYPAQKEIRFATQVLRFVDGSEQRFQQHRAGLRRWIIRLDLLDQSELHLLAEFFRAQAGAAQAFAFTDPSDGSTYSNCSLENPEILLELSDETKGRTSLTIRENLS